jgi:hypothetical protein
MRCGSRIPTVRLMAALSAVFTGRQSEIVPIGNPGRSGSQRRWHRVESGLSRQRIARESPRDKGALTDKGSLTWSSEGRRVRLHWR